MAEPAGWRLSRGALARTLHSLICAHLGERIDFQTFLDNEGFPRSETPIGNGGYPVDSIGLLDLATRISRVFHLGERGEADRLLRKPTLKRWCEVLETCWAGHLDTITFFTSGSTGQPKPVTHRRAHLLDETDLLAELFAGRKRIVACVPSHHIYGFLFTVLLPERMGVPVVEGRILGPKGMRDTLHEGDLIVSHPFHWNFLRETITDFPKSVFGVTSTAPCPADTIHGLESLGLARMTEVYGSSETGGIGARHRPDETYTLFRTWRVDGEELVRVPDGIRVLPPDLLGWEDNRRFRVAGRRDGAVQVAGHNVYPAAIAKIIEEHPEVAACLVRPMRPEEGNRLKAFVVPREASEDLVKRLFAWCDEELRPPQRPGHIRLGSELPRTEMGKAGDWEIT